MTIRSWRSLTTSSIWYEALLRPPHLPQMPQDLQRLSARREELLQLRQDMEDKRFAPWTNDPIDTTIKHARAGEELQQVTRDLNAIHQQRHLDAMVRQARDAEEKELADRERAAQEAEEEDWLKEAARELDEQDQQDAQRPDAGSSQPSGGDAGVPANLDAPVYLPDIPSHLVNPSPTYIPEIVIEPLGDAGY